MTGEADAQPRLIRMARLPASSGSGQSICVQRVPDHSTAVLAAFWSSGNRPTNTPSRAARTPAASRTLATTAGLRGSTSMMGERSEAPQSRPPSRSQSVRASSKTPAPLRVESVPQRVRGPPARPRLSTDSRSSRSRKTSAFSDGCPASLRLTLRCAGHNGSGSNGLRYVMVCRDAGTGSARHAAAKPPIASADTPADRPACRCGGSRNAACRAPRRCGPSRRSAGRPSPAGLR